MTIKCLIIDDEPLARETIEDYISKIPNLELIASCKHVFDALEHMQSDSVDLLFSDIHMPEVNGIDFIRSLQNPPYVIFISAYPNYAVDGFDLDALDYIVKPFPFERFLRAVNKASKIIYQKGKISDVPKNQHLFVKDGHKLHRVMFDEICYVEGMKDYVKLVLKDRTIVTHLTMKRIEDQLPEDKFIRIQKSFIIKKDEIKSFNGNEIDLYTLKEKIPIGKLYKDALLKQFGLQTD
ncbi:DNA-binding LytR/AlgR family response regulator [Pedobacter cryoconitis]|uniref:DNA-binding LytR/AlgR family response regulator n=1 Tax=Pedobacter cryoconitis TaxID=188932 RepID=A0A7W8ZJL7_9SPHI|nr:LytTR family DNA-binding domain-containing protein [Pedobacter cryoconitis]MBB5635231.1 DNA-binding LytR/AlgR family response regulator [Pedobacter cryoconitis]MBB6271586.1 DNA-binding LytR/AlgR family response regulator [Pedobacter cryoconitis]